mgnify:CR=1 FL=1
MEDEDKYLIELYHHSDYPKIIRKLIDPVSFKSTKIILEQMKNSICKVRFLGQSGIGFFCRISGQDKVIEALITPEYIINSNIENHHEEKIEINLNDHYKELKLNENRFIYKNEEYHIAIVEIIPKDKINYFLELDDEIYYNSHKNPFKYIGKSIYILHNYKDLAVSYGLIETCDFNENVELFRHKCLTPFYSFGSPILDLHTHTVLGIHKGYKNKSRCLEGTFFTKVFEEFLKLYRIKDSNYKEYKESDFTNCKLLGAGGYGDAYIHIV